MSVLIYLSKSMYMYTQVCILYVQNVQGNRSICGYVRIKSTCHSKNKWKCFEHSAHLHRNTQRHCCTWGKTQLPLWKLFCSDPMVSQGLEQRMGFWKTMMGARALKSLCTLQLLGINHTAIVLVALFSGSGCSGARDFCLDPTHRL